MRKKNYKGRCEKQSLNKCETVCKTYDAVQTAYAKKLQADKGIVSFRCNVFLEGLTEGEYTTDFVCVKEDGENMVRECIFRKNLVRTKTAELLDISRQYWLKHGVKDWGVVIDAKE